MPPLRLRSEQLESLNSAKVLVFEDRVLQHLSECFPQETADLGEEQTRQIVSESRQRAEGHGIKAERDLVKFITLAFVLGPRFDEQREYPWAAQILRGGWVAPPGERVDLLCREAVAHLRSHQERGDEIAG